MPNPFAARKSRTSSERVDPLDGFCARCAALGALPEEIATIRAYWSVFDDDWTPEKQAEVLVWTDEQIVNELVTSRVEHVAHTVEPDRPFTENEAPSEHEAMAIAVELLATSIPQIMSWVGDDADRAELIRSLESARGDGARTSLLGKLDRVIVHGEADDELS